MPTENRSNDADGWIACDDGLHLIQMDKNLSHYGWVFRKVDGGLPYSVREATPHEMAHAEARQHLRIGVAQIAGQPPAPQPHPEPIAWMVGTAFWWTKEEAERDAAASGKTITPFGPMFDTVEVERLKQELLAARAQGRAEVVEMIAQLDAETGLDEFIGSHQIGCTGEWGSHWEEEALRQHFDVDPSAAGELELARHSSYEIMLLEEERDTLRAQLAEARRLFILLTENPHLNTGGLNPEMLAFLSASAEPSAPVSLQARVEPWLMQCFGEMIAGDREERNHRFLEEALELVQALGATAAEAHQLVDYVFGRAVGEPGQEVGGVMVTLAALCLANDLDMHRLAETELARIWTKVDAIRAKQASKPQFGPLPGVYPDRKQ